MLIKEKIYKVAKLVSVYEFMEDLQAVAEGLGQKDLGWKRFSQALMHINPHVKGR